MIYGEKLMCLISCFVPVQFLKTDYGVVCEVLEPVISAKAKVMKIMHSFHS